MAYVTIALNHMRAVRAWADANGAEANLDLRSFELEVKARNRYYRLKPRFVGRHDGDLYYVDKLTEEATGFVGWLPYQALQCDLSNDKLVFKKFAQDSGLRVPAAWIPKDPPAGYLLKRSVGSFGRQMSGPFAPGTAKPPMPPPSRSKLAGSVYAEQFIDGDILKVWYWGDKPFFAHCDPRPCIIGDGASNIATLVARKLAATGSDWDTTAHRPVIQACLAYQGLPVEQVLAPGQQAWIDFRYGTTHEQGTVSTRSDDRLGTFSEAVLAQLEEAGRAVYGRLKTLFGAPVLYALDGIVDASGQVWWLELNSSPMLPPDGYELIFATLFGQSEAPAAGALPER